MMRGGRKSVRFVRVRGRVIPVLKRAAKGNLAAAGASIALGTVTANAVQKGRKKADINLGGFGNFLTQGLAASALLAAVATRSSTIRRGNGVLIRALRGSR